MMKVPEIDGVRIINRHLLYKYEQPLHKVATDGKMIIVFYEGDTIPEYLTAI